MKNEFTVLAVMHKHKAGKNPAVSLRSPITHDLYSVRKELEKYGLNKYKVTLLQLNNRNVYALQFSEPTLTGEEIHNDIATSFDVPKEELPKLIENILSNHKLENE